MAIVLPLDVTFAPIESLLVAWSTALFAGANSCTETPDDLVAELPVIQWFLVGGLAGVITLDTARVDYDVYEVDRPAAEDLAGQVRAALLYKLPGHTSGSFVVTDVDEISRPGWRPYDDTKLRRYGGTVDVTTHLTNT